MKIRDTIQDWGRLAGGAGGSYSGNDRFSVDPETSFIKGVEDNEDRFGQKFIRLTVQKADNNIAMIIVQLRQIIPSKKAVFEKVVKGLKSAIDKTLNEAGEIII